MDLLQLIKIIRNKSHMEANITEIKYLKNSIDSTFKVEASIEFHQIYQTSASFISHLFDFQFELKHEIDKGSSKITLKFLR